VSPFVRATNEDGGREQPSFNGQDFRRVPKFSRSLVMPRRMHNGLHGVVERSRAVLMCQNMVGPRPVSVIMGCGFEEEYSTRLEKICLLNTKSKLYYHTKIYILLFLETPCA